MACAESGSTTRGDVEFAPEINGQTSRPGNGFGAMSASEPPPPCHESRERGRLTVDRRQAGTCGRVVGWVLLRKCREGGIPADTGLLLECVAQHTHRMLAGKSPVAAVDEARLLRPAHAGRQQPTRDERRNPHAPFPWRVLAASQRHVRPGSIRPLCLPAVVLHERSSNGRSVRAHQTSIERRNNSRSVGPVSVYGAQVSRPLTLEKTMSVCSHMAFETNASVISATTPSSRFTIAWYCRRQE